jgi:uncharacterized protein YbjT (DUF2867 family)
MPDRKVIAIAGATGAQGGGLARAILQDRSSEFAVRALTRDPDAPAARELARLGAEVVRADVDDEATVRRAFAGAWGAYCVTFYWAHLSPEKETAHAAAMARAARDGGLRHVVWSTLEDTRLQVPLSDNRMPTLMGRYKVPHLDAKGEADRHFRALGVPTTFLLTSFYWDNFIHFGMGPQPTPDGSLAITFPLGHAKMPGIAAEDIGRCAYGIFQRPELIGRTVGIAGEHLSGAEMAAAFTHSLGREVRYQDVPPEVYRGFGFPGADDLGNMFQYFRDFEELVRAARDVRFSHGVNPALQNFATWLERNKQAIPLGRGAAGS